MFIEASLDTVLFRSNPNMFIEKVIKEYVAHSPLNRHVEFDDAPLWEEPIVAFADGDDPIFETYKTIVDEFHMTPREALKKYIQSKGWNYGLEEHPPVSVISYILPVAKGARDADRDSPHGGSYRYNHFRWLGEVFWRNLENYVASLLEIMGHHAFAPGRSIFFQRKELADGARVNWSERHIAYAAGLGTFGLHGLLITKKGCAHWAESVVCDIALTPTPRPYNYYQAYCPFFKDRSCKACIGRCKAGAISEKGRDILICRKYLGHDQRVKLKEAGLDKGYIGKAPTCGLCMTNVPCEDRMPLAG
ncbi:MAG: hypothetical protein ABSD38_22535 [Syntrophorhabdales bacterium]|jgi:hypothetical protein